MHHDAPAQCGRTRPHLPHETTGGRCPGLDAPPPGRHVRGARGLTCDKPGCQIDHPAEVAAASPYPAPAPDPWEPAPATDLDAETYLSWCDDGVTLICERDECRRPAPLGGDCWWQEVLPYRLTPEQAVALRDAHVATHTGVEDDPPTVVNPNAPLVVMGGEGTVTVITPLLHEGRTVVILPGNLPVTLDGENLR